MKKETRNELKKIILQCFQQYFTKSGISKILLTLYMNDLKQKKKKPQQRQKSTKITNILQNNKKTVGKISELRKKQNPKSYFTEDTKNIPELKVSNSNKLNHQLIAKLNQNIDPLANQNGDGSILDNQLPQFLVKGLNKANKG